MGRLGRTYAAVGLTALSACRGGDGRQRDAAGDGANPFPQLLALADAQYNRGQYDSARRTLDDELTRAGQLGDSANIARGWTTLSIVNRWQSRYDEAQSFGERSVSLKRRLGLDAEVAKSLNALGLLANNRGHYDEALRRLQEARDAAEAVQDSAYVAKARGNLGLVYSNMGDVDHARTEFLALRDFGAAKHSARDEATALNNLGMLATRAGDASAAIALLGEARARYAKLGDEAGEENALGQLGVAWQELGETSRALAYLDSALTIARKDELGDAETDDLKLIAEIHEDAGDHEGALKVLARARALADSLKMPAKLGHVLLTEARAYASAGTPSLALVRADEAARREKEADSPIDELAAELEIAALAQRIGKAAHADSALVRAQTIADSLGSGIARIQLALGVARVADAADRSDQVLSLVNRMGRDTALLTPGESSERETLRAHALLRRGEFAAAAASGGRAVAGVERLRSNLGSASLRTSYTADRVRSYGDLVIALLSLNRVDSAFRIADAARGRALIERLNAARRDLPRAGTSGDLIVADSLLRRISALIDQLRIADTTVRRNRSGPASDAPMGDIQRGLSLARTSYDSLLDRMSGSDARSAIVGATTVDVRAIRRVLAADERLIEYFQAADRLLIFVVSPQSVAVANVPVARSVLAEEARRAREIVATAGGQPAEPLSALYASLIAPLDQRRLLAGARRLVIVPHGALTYCPFAALRESDRAPYLIERFSLLMLTSASALVPLRNDSARVSANGSQVFAPLTRQLPASRGEAIAVAARLAVTPVLDSSASEQAVRQALLSSSVVHVASHGTLDAEHPMFSSISLAASRGTAPAPANDGRLETHEVLGMQIRSRLVYLSGCETALGASQPTSSRSDEDYTTLAQAFLFAGASNVVATLWRIDDRAATDLAMRFYGGLAASSPADALAAAQRSMIRDPRYAAPYYWAAYTVSGSGVIR